MPTNTLSRECGWCGEHMGVVACAPGCEGVSTGICDDCCDALFIKSEGDE